jgi:hypothetical protein
VVRAIALGAGVVLAVGIPVATIGSLVLDEGSNAVFPLAALVIAAFVGGGWVAGREAPSSPLVVGAVAALVGFAIAQTVSIVLQVVDDDDVDIAPVLANAALAAAAGLLGARFAPGRT